MIAAMVIAFAVVAVGCGGGKTVNGGTATGITASNRASSQPAACKSGKPLTSPEVGVTPTTITVTTVADVGSVIKPSLFLGSWNGVKAWADYVNTEFGGLACRKVVVKTADSKLTADDAKSAIASACSDSFATVGTTAVFFSDVSAMNRCKDKAGNASGLPDIAVLQTDSAQQCSPVSFATLSASGSCPYSGSGPRTFTTGQTEYDFYLSKFGKDSMHGVWAIPKDLPSTIDSTMPLVRAANKMGIRSDFEKGMSTLDLQTAYTPLVAAMIRNRSTYARNGLDYSGTVAERKEARAQGVSTVKVWDCGLQCYDKRLITEAQGATEDQYVWLNLLPIEDGNANSELAKFLQYDKQPDAFGEQAWVTGEIFARAVNDTMAANGNDPNALTRANILAALRGLHDFNAGGMLPPGTDIGNKKMSLCLVGMQVQNGKFVRIDPVQPGTFDCDNNKPPIVQTIDPQREYHG
jgi:hypothetical protein